MYAHIDEGLLKDTNNYYFNLLSDRFHPLHVSWEANLKKRFGSIFKPIFVLPAQHNALFKDENYVVISQFPASAEIALNLAPHTFVVPAADDLNKQFSDNEVVRDLIAKLLTKQEQVFVLSLTSVGLRFDDSRVKILGPDPKVAERFDDKAEHLNVFRHLGLPTNHTWVYASYDEMLAKHTEYPFFLSATFSSAGSDSRIIQASHELMSFHENVRPHNKGSHFIAARLLTDIVNAPNVCAMVLGENNTVVVCLTDQILRGHQYLGNIYPSSVSDQHRSMILEMTTTVGNYLSTQGFRGLFGLDFLITSAGDCYPLDLNPRRQGSYHCNVMMSKNVDLIDLEQTVIFDETLSAIQHKQFEATYCWAHSKIMSHRPSATLGKGFEMGEPLMPYDTIGTYHAAAWYTEGSVLKGGAAGHYACSGSSRLALLEKLGYEVDELIARLYTYPESNAAKSD